ncbi:BrnT family toxin [candidate division KSB1 bacterium]|nr:BrnT family toxin [candidate division KSB1 bacterium]
MGWFKDRENKEKHCISFAVAQYAFADYNRIILKDLTQSIDCEQYYYIGKVNDGILTVRFTYRNDSIRIFGA